jgi:hypothetical protein
MVVAMVRFSAALVERADSPATVGWGVVYAGSWAALLNVMSRLASHANDPSATPLLTLVVAAWGTFHAFWIWLVLGTSPARATVRTAAGRICLAGLVVLAAAIWQVAFPESPSPARFVRGLGPLGWMVLIGIAALALGIYRATRSEPGTKPAEPEEAEEDDEPV